MRAALWYKAKDMRVEEIPTPELTPGMALVRVDRTGICGTDLEEYLLGPVIIPQGRYNWHICTRHHGDSRWRHWLRHLLSMLAP